MDGASRTKLAMIDKNAGAGSDAEGRRRGYHTTRSQHHYKFSRQ